MNNLSWLEVIYDPKYGEDSSEVCLDAERRVACTVQPFSRNFRTTCAPSYVSSAVYLGNSDV